MLYPQNGDRIVAIDSVTQLHPVYTTVSNSPAKLLKKSRQHFVENSKHTPDSFFLFRQSYAEIIRPHSKHCKQYEMRPIVADVVA